MRKRAKVAATGADQDERQHLQDDEYDDLGEAYTPTRADTSAVATTKKRKRAPRDAGGKPKIKGSKPKAEPQPAEVDDTVGNLERMMRLPLDVIYEVRLLQLRFTLGS